MLELPCPRGRPARPLLRYAWCCPSVRVQRYGLHDIVMVARRIGDQRRRLSLANGVAGAHRDGVGTLPGRQIEAPGPEREAAEILAELSLRPGLAAVGRVFD